MADDSLESLVIDTRFNTAGLDQSEREVLAALNTITTAVNRASNAFPPLNIDTTQLIASLRRAGQDVAGFFDGFSVSAAAAAADAGALGALAQRSSAAADAFRAAGVAEGSLNATLERSGLLSVEAAGAAERLAQGILRTGAVAANTGSSLERLAATPVGDSLDEAADRLQKFFAGFAGAPIGEVITALQGLNAELAATGRVGFTQDLVQTLIAERNELNQTSQQARELTVIIDGLRASEQRLSDERRTAETRPAFLLGPGTRPAAQSAVQPGALPVDQFAAFRREATATTPALDEVAAAMGRATAGANAYRQGLSVLAAQQKATAAETAINARVTQAFNEAGRQANLGPFARGLENIRLTGQGARTEILAGVPAFEKHEHGAVRAANALSALAASAVGVEGPIGRLAETGLLLSGGLGVVAVVAGSVLALAKAHEFLTTAEREAAVERERLVSGLLQEARGSDSATAAATALTAAMREQVEARKSLVTRAAETIAPIGKIITDPFGTGVKVVNEAQRQSSKRAADAATAEAQAVRNAQDINVRLLTQVIGLRAASTEEIARGLSLLRSLQQQEQSGLVPPQRRLELLQQIKALQASINHDDEVNARLGAERTAAGSLNAARQQAIRAEEAETTASFARLALITETSLQNELAQRVGFFAARRRLIIDAARADEAELRSSLSAEERRNPADEQGRITQRATVDGLRAQLALRQSVLATSLRQLDTDQQVERLSVLGKVAPPIVQAEADFAFRLKPKVDASALRAALEAEITDIRRNTTDDAFQIDFTKATSSAETLLHVLDGMTLALDEVGNANINKPFADARTSAERLGDSVASIGNAIEGIGRVRDAIKGTGRDAGDAIGNIQDLGQSINNIGIDITKGDFVGALVDVVKGVKSIGHLLGFGKSETEKLLEAAQRANTAALHEATVALHERFQGGGGVGEQQTLVQRALDTPDARRAIAASDTTALNAAIEKTGLTFDQVREIARSYGISLVQDHHLVEGAAKALTDRLAIAAFEATHFGSSLAEQTDRLNLGARLRGEDTNPQANFAREAQAASVLSPAVAAALRGVDVKNEAALRAALQGLFDKIDKGNLTTGDLGGLTKDEFVKLLGDGADALDAFKSSVDAATQSSLNIPEGFRLAALAFQASDRGPAVQQAAPPSVPPPSVDPGAVNPEFAAASAATNQKLDVIASQTPADLLAALDAIRTNSPPDVLAALEGLRTTAPPDQLAALAGIAEAIGELTRVLGVVAPPTLPPPAQTPGANATSFQPADVRTGPSPSFVFAAGAITIHASPDQSEVEIARLVVEEMRRLALRQGGDTLHIGSPT